MASCMATSGLKIEMNIHPVFSRIFHRDQDKNSHRESREDVADADVRDGMMKTTAIGRFLGARRNDARMCKKYLRLIKE